MKQLKGDPWSSILLEMEGDYRNILPSIWRNSGLLILIVGNLDWGRQKCRNNEKTFRQIFCEPFEKKFCFAFAPQTLHKKIALARAPQIPLVMPYTTKSLWLDLGHEWGWHSGAGFFSSLLKGGGIQPTSSHPTNLKPSKQPQARNLPPGGGWEVLQKIRSQNFILPNLVRFFQGRVQVLMGVGVWSVWETCSAGSSWDAAGAPLGGPLPEGFCSSGSGRPRPRKDSARRRQSVPCVVWVLLWMASRALRLGQVSNGRPKRIP